MLLKKEKSKADWKRENKAYIEGYKQGKEEGERRGLYKRYSSNQLRELLGFEQIEEHDVVNHPNHYQTGKYNCIEVMEEALGKEVVKDFCLCNAFKYIYRHKRKNGLEDIKKAQYYINKYVEIEESEND